MAVAILSGLLLATSNQTNFCIMSFSFNFPGAPNASTNTNTDTTDTQPETSEQEQTREETNTNVNNDPNTEQTSRTAPIPPSFTFGASDPPETGTPIFGGFSGATFSSQSGGTSIFGSNTTTFGTSVFGATESKPGPITFGTPNTPSFGIQTGGFKFGGTQAKETNSTTTFGGGFSFGGQPLPSVQSFSEALASQTSVKKLAMPLVALPEPTLSVEKKEKLFEFNVPLLDPKPTKASTNGKKIDHKLTIVRNSNTIWRSCYRRYLFESK